MTAAMATTVPSSPESLDTSLTSAYIQSNVSEARERELRLIVNPPRGPTTSVPGLSMRKGLTTGDYMFGEFFLPKFVGCVTAEMSKRPIPQVFQSSETRKVENLFEQWAERMYAWLLPQIRAPYQTLNRTSRLGWPLFSHPASKLDAVMAYLPAVIGGDLSEFEAAFIILNIRLQAEPRDKIREMQFITDQGIVYAEKVDRRNYKVLVEDMLRIPSRVRNVFNMPMLNLIKQCLDTAIHDALLCHRAFHHDMFGGNIAPVRGYHLCFDVKHMERHTAGIVRRRASIIGGVYGDIVKLFSRIPFLVPSDTRKSVKLITVNRDRGWTDQFASGDSAVAPAQKELFLVLYAEFARTHLGLDQMTAIRWVAGGGDERLTIRNYGDDNSVSGDHAVIHDCLAFLKNYLTVEEETPPKFLGFVWYPELGWRLPVDSYLTKTYLNERAPGKRFRKFPFLGWSEKRKIFRQLGHPDVPTKVYPVEDAALARVGLAWSKVEEQAEYERKQAASAGLSGVLNPNYVLGKAEWNLSAKEKMATGEYQGIHPELTKKIILALVGREWSNKLKLNSI